MLCAGLTEMFQKGFGSVLGEYSGLDALTEVVIRADNAVSI